MRGLIAGLTCAAACAVWLGAAEPLVDPRTPSDWFAQGLEAARKAAEGARVKRPARNVILFVGDGMSLTTVVAARILEGQRAGSPGEEHLLAFEKLPFSALARTYAIDAQVADSAATMTAMVTGVKTLNGALSMSSDARPLTTLLEIFEKEGRSTGVVTTTRLTHATPAACYAHIAGREAESDAGLSDEDRAAGVPDIARQLVEWGSRPGDGLEVAMGGGRGNFLPQQEADPESGSPGRRSDGRNLAQEWARLPRSAYVWNTAGLDALDLSKIDHLLGLFEPSHMGYETSRASDRGGEPSLARMTERALDILQRNKRGYFLMVEGGRIDHAHHDGNAYRALDETIAFAAAVEVARRRVSEKDTLLVVTADHGHVLTFAGYSARGNPILGLTGSPSDPRETLDGRHYTTLGYANGPGAIKGERPDLRDTDTTARDYLQQATVPLESETHSGDDVPVYAGGARAALFHGVIEQNVIFHLIVEAAGLKASPPGR
ncbi:MAG: alkaline phosphatase [Candidatus Polarisedimenticolia bacterium]